MSNFHNICFVSQVTISSVAYYYCSSYNIATIALDGNTYQPYIISVGNAEKIANFGECNQISKCSMSLLLGQIQYQNAFTIDISLPWNNGVCEIRLYDKDNDSNWADCDYYYKGIIKNFVINDDNVFFDIEDSDHRDNIILPVSTVEDIVNDISYLDLDDIPKKSVGKYIPIQIGELDDINSGTFAKGILISNNVGFQEIYYDITTLNTFLLSSTSGIGVWDSGLNRYFVGNYDGEYEVVSDNNVVKFKVDTTTTLHSGFSMSATSGQEQILVENAHLLTFDRESADNYYTDAAELLGSNIIAIDNELMILLDEPDYLSSPHTVWVERGYNNTTVVEHSAGATIYQSAKYSAKNLISFTELFLAKVVANPHFKINIGASDVYETEPDKYIVSDLGNAVDNNIYTHFGFYQYSGAVTESQLNFDIRFEKIEGDYNLTGIFLGVKLYCNNVASNLNTVNDYSLIRLNIFDPNQDINFNEEADVSLATGNAKPVLVVYCFYDEPSHKRSIDTISEISRDFVTNEYVNIFDLRYAFSPNLGSVVEDENAYALSITTLKDLNRKWKVNLLCKNIQYSETKNLYSNYYINIYQIGLWADFFIDFTARPIMGTLKGREITATVDTILNTSIVGNLVDHPIQALLLLLTDEMGYNSDDFDSDSWQSVYTYIWNVYYSYTLGNQQKITLSYGIDEHDKGWNLCQNIASQFCMSLTKTDEGKIKLISLSQLQDTGFYGYRSLTSYKMSVDDIVMSGSKKNLSIQQTGTNRIRNVVRINYNRNNSTDEYQLVYPNVQNSLDSYILIESGNTLSNARTIYYNSQKTEALEIDAFAISQEADAERLCKWHLNDKAEIHYYITMSLPYFHYSDINSKATQYDIGDIVYLDGIYKGITFNSTHKFVVRQIEKTDQGRAILMAMKSIEPVSEF